ncbi:unnamed protein product [Cuscuta campestris]|uniref:DNA (cytosine-5-)-methyltransferase n=1 Tax=Cuscuta campestris TaxID=132261 RepID=A0A484MK04_9ASTE|nr:unnamed protein product [Cuscuta campestris]
MVKKPSKISSRSSTPAPSSSRPSIGVGKSAKKRDALALALYVDAESGHSSVPLKVFYPDSDFPPQVNVRRSTRVTSNKYRSAPPALPPARSKSTPARPLLLTSPSRKSGSEFHKERQRCNGVASDMQKRLRPRKTVVEVGVWGKQVEKCDPQKHSSTLGDKRERSRQGKRIDSVKNTSKKEVKIASMRIGSHESFFENKYSITSDVVTKDEWMDPVSSALADTSEESKSEKGNSDMDANSVNCLRSRKIKFGLVSQRTAVKTSALSNACGSGGEVLRLEEKVACTPSKGKEKKGKSIACFVGEPIPAEEAQERWRWRYDLKSQRREKQGWILNANEEDEVILNVGCHYAQANIFGSILNIGDCAYVKGEGMKKHVGRILEFFKTTEGEDYFRVQWFFRAEDTVMKDAATLHDKRRLFYSNLTNDNLLDCLISKVNVTIISSGLDFKVDDIPPSDFYYDMEYCVDYSTFRNLPTVEKLNSGELVKVELSLLDLYAGCGGMSTGLCIGAKLSGLNLVTKWAVDYKKSACDSLKLNHPETQVRNEPVEHFLTLLKEWEKLCEDFGSTGSNGGPVEVLEDTEEVEDTSIYLPDSDDSDAEYEILRLVDICYGDPNGTGKPCIHFQVRWKGFGPSEDTWEPIYGLKNSKESIHDFVRRGKNSRILPLPGDVDVICGGPPCQGISGYNRHRNVNAPLEDERNRQIIIFMDVVEFLRPKYVFMENVPDILRFDKGSLGRYALSRLVRVRYQTRLGILAAGCYGLPQFRLRVFILAALPSEKLPPFPLPTHDVIMRHWPPPEFERNVVAYDEGQPRELEEALVLQDALSDLPAVTSREVREEMPYCMPPESDFQKYIRLPEHEIMGSTTSTQVRGMKDPVLYDHRPRLLSEDDMTRVSLIPHRKGANFLDFPGVILVNNTAHRDPNKEPELLPSGRPLVPDCIFTFQQGKSKRPFARLWWDETVATLVTFPNCFSHAILHPDQDRVLTIREYARLQGFPDFYRFCGTISERYCQLGNAVAIPVGRALGYALGMAFQSLTGDEPLIKLPPKFAFSKPPVEEIVEQNRFSGCQA